MGNHQWRFIYSWENHWTTNQAFSSHVCLPERKNILKIRSAFKKRAKQTTVDDEIKRQNSYRKHRNDDFWQFENLLRQSSQRSQTLLLEAPVNRLSKHGSMTSRGARGVKLNGRLKKIPTNPMPLINNPQKPWFSMGFTPETKTIELMGVFDTLGMGLFCQNPLLMIQSLKISIVLLVISLMMSPWKIPLQKKWKISWNPTQTSVITATLLQSSWLQLRLWSGLKDAQSMGCQSTFATMKKLFFFIDSKGIEKRLKWIQININQLKVTNMF